MCVPACAHAGDEGHRESRHSNCVKIISPWLEEGSLHWKAILGIKKKKKKIFKEGGRKACREGAGRSEEHVRLRRHPAVLLPSRPPARGRTRAPCRPGAHTARRGGGCKGLAAQADLVAGAVVQAVPGSRRSQRAHVTAPALR